MDKHAVIRLLYALEDHLKSARGGINQNIPSQVQAAVDQIYLDASHLFRAAYDEGN